MRFGEYSAAEGYYRTGADMIPTRMMPNYSLWKLYLETGDTANAISAAQRVVSQKLKMENTLNILKREEVKNWLEKQ